MAAADNYWDEARGEWIDRATGNHMKPAPAGDGIWRSPDNSQMYVGAGGGQGTWVPNSDGTNTSGLPNGNVISSGLTTGAAAVNGSGSGYGLAPDYQWTVDDLNRQHDIDLANINNTFTAQEAALTRSASLEQAKVIAQINADVENRRITVDEAQHKLDQAQQESQYARSLALQTLTADRDYQIKAAEQSRQERLTQAQLAANPEDTVAYEFYKRGLASPEALATARAFQAGGTASPATAGAGAGAGATAGAATTGAPSVSGVTYPDAPPAYSDATLATLANTAQNPGTIWNPGLSGTGAFGAQIQGPNQLSRREASQMSPTEMGILTSFLKAGVDTGNGRRVAIKPDDYFKQVQDSWVPTLAGSTGNVTQYR